MSGEVEVAAREMGWRPKEEFRGDPEKWVEAEEFVRRGENFIPLLRKSNADLKGKLDTTVAEVGQLKTLLQASHEAIEALKEYQGAETKRQVERARKELMAQLKTARDDGDVEAEEQLREQLQAIREAKEEIRAAPPAPAPAPAADAPHPDFEGWVADNPWFKTDHRRRALALGIADEIRADSKNASLQGRAFFDKVAEELETYLAGKPVSKVDGGRPNGSGTSAAPRQRNFSDLPADAKEACERQAARLVGPGRAFKDMDAWRAHYAKIFFEETV